MNFGLDRAAMDLLSKIWRGVQAPSQNTIPVNISTTSTFMYCPQTHGQCCTINATGAITITFDVMAGCLLPGAVYEIRIVAGDTSARTYAYNSTNIKFSGAAISLSSGSTTAGGVDKFFFRATSTNTMEDAGFRSDVR